MRRTLAGLLVALVAVALVSAAAPSAVAGTTTDARRALLEKYAPLVVVRTQSGRSAVRASRTSPPRWTRCSVSPTWSSADPEV